MASTAQIRANRANAKHSTGPKTVAGRRRVAGNALRHGLTSTDIDSEVVLNFYWAIMNDTNASPLDAIGDQFKEASLKLANSEAQLLKIRNTLAALDQCIAQLILRIEKEGMMVEQLAVLESIFENVGLPASAARDPNHWFYSKLQIVGNTKNQEPLMRALDEVRKLIRYRAEAEAVRERDFKNWIICRDTLDQENPLIGAICIPERQRKPNFDWKNSKSRNKANLIQ